MKKIKINFCDFYSEFDKKSSFLYKILQKFYIVEISEQPDYLFYSVFGIEHTKYNNCVKIFYTGENIIPDFNECDYAIGFNDITFEDRYIRYLCNYNSDLTRKNISKELINRNFCNFIYSNGSMGEGAKLRQDFFTKLSKYKHIDAPGKICNNMIAKELEPRFGDWYKSKTEFLKKYKFTIAFENSQTNGYVTEKFFQPIQANSIPIYWGALDISKDFNTKAFINCNDYKNFDEVIEKIEYLDNNDEAYLAMLKEPIEKENSRLKNQDEKLEKFLINIIKKGNKPFDKDSMNIRKRLIYTNNTHQKENIISKIFSIQNEYTNGKKHKIIKIMGFKIKIATK